MNFLCCAGFGSIFPGLTFRDAGIANPGWLTRRGMPSTALITVLANYVAQGLHVFTRDYAVDSQPDLKISTIQRPSFSPATERAADDRWCLQAAFGQRGGLFREKQKVRPDSKLRVGWVMGGWDDLCWSVGDRFVTNPETGVLYEQF